MIAACTAYVAGNLGLPRICLAHTRTYTCAHPPLRSPPRQAFSFVVDNTPAGERDALPGLCLYTELWLARVSARVGTEGGVARMGHGWSR